MKKTTAKKLKYGSLSIVLTVVFVALIIGVNLIVSSLGGSVNLSVDLTEEQFYSISPDTDTALRAGLGDLYDSFKVTIKFLTARDIIEGEGASGNYTRYYVQQLAEEYARRYPDNITVEYIDITKNPAAVDKYLTETQTSVNANYVIIEGDYHYRILNFAAFYLLSEEDGSVYAFQGEVKLTAAILQSSIDTPQAVTFTAGHGETISKKLEEIFDEALFDIQVVDLSKNTDTRESESASEEPAGDDAGDTEEVSEVRGEISDETRILVISNPLTDFQGFDPETPDAVTEIDKLNEYMQSYRSLIVLVNASTPALPNLQEYLWEYWGLDYKPFHKIEDSKSCLPGNTASVIAETVGTSESGHAYMLHETVRNSGSGIRTVFRNSVELVVDTSKTDKTVEVAFQTSADATSTYEGTSETGSFPLVGLSADLDYAEDNSAQFKYVMLIGSTDFASDSFLNTGYGNSKVMSSAARMMATERNIPDIDYKPLADTALVLTEEQAENLTIFITVAAPVAVMIVGLVVYLKRRHL